MNWQHLDRFLFLSPPLGTHDWSFVSGQQSGPPVVLDVWNRSMGQKDHVEAGAGHILDLGPDVEYLHVAGADRQAGTSDGPPAMEEQGECPGTSIAAVDSPPLPTANDAHVGSEGEGELAVLSDTKPTACHNPDGGEVGSASSKNTHQPLCRTQCVDLGTEGPPEPPSDSEHNTPDPSSPRKQPSEQPPSSEPVSETSLKEYRTKLEFALKLGYCEETVRQVLSKLGPDTLINDILGELVKLGTKSDSEQPGRTLASTSSSSSSSSSCGCSDPLDSQRSDSPCPPESFSEQDNLRPIVVDGSNVAMR